MTETDLSDWLAIADAAKVLGCSTRTIERLGRARKLEQRLRPQAGSPAVAVYNPDDVARLAQERRPAPAPFVLPAGPTNGDGMRTHASTSTHMQTRASASLSASDDDPIRQLFAAALRAVLSPPSPPMSVTVAETLFLTLKDAAALTGLSQAFLRRMITAGTLTAIRDRGWRIRRKDLEAL
jgi:excisionase family DNA binding protein